MSYQVQESKITNLFTGAVKATKFEIRNADSGDLYATLDNQADAEIVAFGLNNNYLRNALGGFADNVLAEIKKAMAGEMPAAWAIEQD